MFVSGIGIYAVAGGVLGIRRAVPVLLALCLFAAAGFAHLARGRDRVVTTCAVLLALACLPLPATQLVACVKQMQREHIALKHSTVHFVFEDSMNMAQSFRTLQMTPNAVDLILETAEPMRLLPILHLLSGPEGTGGTSVSKERILDRHLHGR
jgi:hypothetical protein